MRQIIVLTAGCIFILNAFAPKFVIGDKIKWEDKYCAVLKNGEMTVMNGSTELVVNITLDNGSTITTDGYIVSKDGTRTALKAGECVNKAGNIIQGKKGTDKNTNSTK